MAEKSSFSAIVACFWGRHCRHCMPEVPAASTGVLKRAVDKPFNKMCCKMAQEREKCVFLYL